MKDAVVYYFFEEGIIDFKSVLLYNYKKLNLTELDYVLLVNLYLQAQKGNQSFSPTKIKNKLGVNKELLFERLDFLIKNKLLQIEVEINSKGKSVEIYNLTPMYAALIKLYEDEFEKVQEESNSTIEEKIAALYDEIFRKQITPVEIELIEKWVEEDKFSFDEIQNAMYDGAKQGKISLRQIDAKLVKSRAKAEQDVDYSSTTSKIMAELHKEWKK